MTLAQSVTADFSVVPGQVLQTSPETGGCEKEASSRSRAEDPERTEPAMTSEADKETHAQDPESDMPSPKQPASNRRSTPKKNDTNREIGTRRRRKVIGSLKLLLHQRVQRNLKTLQDLSELLKLSAPIVTSCSRTFKVTDAKPERLRDSI